MWAKWAKIRDFFVIFYFGSLVFLDIAQDCSLGQCLTSSRAENSKKNLWIFLF